MRAIVQDFKDVICEELGWVRGAHHTINTPPGAVIWGKWHLMPHHLLSKIWDEVRMLEQEVIKSSRHPWQSPLVLVPKPDRTLRLCGLSVPE